MLGPDLWGLMFDGQDPVHAVSLDVQSLDFGTCSRLSTAEYKSVIVTNNTSAKVCVCWGGVGGCGGVSVIGPITAVAGCRSSDQ